MFGSNKKVANAKERTSTPKGEVLRPPKVPRHAGFPRGEHRGYIFELWSIEYKCMELQLPTCLLQMSWQRRRQENEIKRRQEGENYLCILSDFFWKVPRRFPPSVVLLSKHIIAFISHWNRKSPNSQMGVHAASTLNPRGLDDTPLHSLPPTILQ